VAQRGHCQALPSDAQQQDGSQRTQAEMREIPVRHYEKCFATRVEKHWDGFLRRAVQSLSLEKVLRNLHKTAPALGGGWTRWPPVTPFNLNSL